MRITYKIRKAFPRVPSPQNHENNSMNPLSKNKRVCIFDDIDSLNGSNLQNSIVQDIFYNQNTIFKDCTIENELNMQTRKKQDDIPSY